MDQFQNYTQFLHYVEDNYDEEEQIIIENFISYYINKYRGFGHLNCESTYQDDLKLDSTGKLHQLALIGFEFEKQNTDKRKLKKIEKKYH